MPDRVSPASPGRMVEQLRGECEGTRPQRYCLPASKCTKHQAAALIEAQQAMITRLEQALAIAKSTFNDACELAIKELHEGVTVDAAALSMRTLVADRVSQINALTCADGQEPR
jgi:hypothetical protein